jgi:ATP-binding protein involved in chromosome partitioning
VKRYRDIAGDGGSDVAGQVGAQLDRLRRRLEPIRFVVAVVSGKGGVGKSTLTGGLACAFALDGWRVAVLDTDLNGPSMAKVLGARGARLQIGAGEIEPPAGILGIRVMSMDLLLPGDAAPLVWDAPTQAEAHTWRGTMEANALREFLADTAWGALDVLVLDLPPGTDRLATVVSLVPGLAGTILVTIPSDLSQLIVKKSITVARGSGVPVLGLVENMAGLFAGPDAETLARDAGIPFLGAVPFDRELALAADRGEPFVQTRADSEAARVLRGIAARVRAALERARPGERHTDGTPSV